MLPSDSSARLRACYDACNRDTAVDKDEDNKLTLFSPLLVLILRQQSLNFCIVSLSRLARTNTRWVLNRARPGKTVSPTLSLPESSTTVETVRSITQAYHLIFLFLRFSGSRETRKRTTDGTHVA